MTYSGPYFKCATTETAIPIYYSIWGIKEAENNDYSTAISIMGCWIVTLLDNFTIRWQYKYNQVQFASPNTFNKCINRLLSI